MAVYQENSVVNQLVTDLLSSANPEHRKELLAKYAAISATQAAMYEHAFSLLRDLSHSSRQEGSFRVKPFVVIDQDIDSKLPLTSTLDDDAQDFIAAALALELAKVINEMQESVQEINRISAEIEQIYNEQQALSDQEGDMGLKALFNEQLADEQPESQQKEMINPRPTPVVVDKVDNNNNEQMAEPKPEQQVGATQKGPRPQPEILNEKLDVLEQKFERAVERYVQSKERFEQLRPMLKNRSVPASELQNLHNNHDQDLVTSILMQARSRLRAEANSNSNTSSYGREASKLDSQIKALINPPQSNSPTVSL